MGRRRKNKRPDEATRIIGQIIVTCRQIAADKPHGVWWLRQVLETARFAKISSK
jgi:hypothetical protein